MLFFGAVEDEVLGEVIRLLESQRKSFSEEGSAVEVFVLSLLKNCANQCFQLKTERNFTVSGSN